MGTWAEGNLDNDAALDYLGDLLEELSEEISDAISDGDLAIDEGFDDAMATLEVIRILCTHSPAAPPKADILSEWQKGILKVFDDQIDDLGPVEGFKEARRKVIAKTFDDLLARSREFWKK
jgi:hypothetical protein